MRATLERNRPEFSRSEAESCRQVYEGLCNKEQPLVIDVEVKIVEGKREIE